jgi:anti-sigma regulatory factor (Ser/Thr protein kinase)
MPRGELVASMSATVELSISADVGEIARVQEAVAVLAGDHVLSARAAHALAVALDELLSNVILHGYADASSGKSVFVRIAREASEVTVEIVDQARPFDPTKSDPPDLDGELEDREIGGLGLHLVRTLVRGLSYDRSENENRTRFTVPIRPAGEAAS